MADDKNLEVVALQRTADNKFMRLFVDEPESPEELADGLSEDARGAVQVSAG